jgi:hypothetical protein
MWFALPFIASLRESLVPMLKPGLGFLLMTDMSLLRFGYLGKWSPCVCESLNTKGETITLVTLLYDSNFTLT